MSYMPRNQLLLSSTFNLNSSFTKQIIIGTLFENDAELYSVLNFVSSHLRSSISFNLDDWNIFKSYLKNILSYFNGNEAPLELIECDKFQLRFGVLLGENTVALQDIRNEKSCYPILLKMESLKILEGLIPCVDERFEFLSSVNFQKVYSLLVKCV